MIFILFWGWLLFPSMPEKNALFLIKLVGKICLYPTLLIAIYGFQRYIIDRIIYYYQVSLLKNKEYNYELSKKIKNDTSSSRHYRYVLRKLSTLFDNIPRYSYRFRYHVSNNKTAYMTVPIVIVICVAIFIIVLF